MRRVVDKAVFVHFSKAAGRFINYYLTEHVFRSRTVCLAEQNYKLFNSWHKGIGLQRDWNERELKQLANNRHPLQSPSPEQIRSHHALWRHDYLARQYVHNHNNNWSRSSLREFKRNGWFSFMFLRDPAELLCSLWTWASMAVAEGADPGTVLTPVWLIDQPLDGFIRTILCDRQFDHLYALPGYVEEIDYVAEFTEDNFRHVLQSCFDHEFQPQLVEEGSRFPSGNPGYAQYRSRGQISDTVHMLLQNSPLVQSVRDRLSCSARLD